MPERDWSTFVCPNPNCASGRGQRHAAYQSSVWRQPQHRPSHHPSGRRPCPRIPEQMVQHVQVNQVQVDEVWAFVGKKGQTL